jgi:hypothetical protein
MASAKERFEKLDSLRDQVVDRARQAADITIPALMPPEGIDENASLPSPYQSLGARGVNNLTSKLRLSLFPPGQAFFRLAMDDATRALIAGEDPGAENKIDKGLQKIENDALELLEAGNHGVILHAAIKQLVAAGNVLLHIPTEGGSRIFRLPMYVVVRDPMGNWHEIVAKESVHRTTLEEATKEAVTIKDPAGDPEEDDENIDVFTRVTRVDGKAEWYQEINDVEVPNSRGKSEIEDCPYIPLRWAALENENYGRGHVEEYLGDLRSLEELSKSLVAFAVAAAKVIFLDRPNSVTDIEAIELAESGSFVEGNPEDIGVLQVEKFHDFQVAKAQIDDLSLRISHAFLLQSGTVRNAERVTKAEIQAVAQELEDVLGGVYSVLAQEMQLPVVRRLMAQLKKQGKMPQLPKGTLKPVIVTGFDALGRGHELNKFRAFMADGVAMFGEGFVNEFNVEAGADVLSTHHNIDISGMKKTTEQKEQETQQQMVAQGMDTMGASVAGPVAQGMVDKVNKPTE